MAKVVGEYRLVAGLLTNVCTAGEAVWAVVLTSQAEKLLASEKLHLNVRTVVGSSDWYVYVTYSEGEALSFIQQWFPDT